jgi:Uncharacterized protein conserved in bacteria (DUF2330)
MLKLIFRSMVVSAFTFNLLSIADACGGFSVENGVYPIPSDEVALMIYDQKTGVEHFIRQARFQNLKSDFVVPVPSTPELSEAPEELAGLAYSRLYRSSSGSIGGGGGSFGRSGGSADGVVEVVKQQEVAGMNAVVLKSSGVGALEQWLKQNGYKVPEGSRPWIDRYVKLKWQFVAFKLKATKDQKSTSPWVRISFKSPRAVYPYSEPAGAQAQTKRELSLMIIAPTDVVGSYSSIKPWKTAFDFSRSMGPSEGKLDSYVKSVVGKDTDISAWKLSHFRDTTTQRPSDEDIFFDAKMN